MQYFLVNSGEMSKKESSPRIIVFSTPSCGWCRKLKSYLREKGFRFRDVDISKDEKAVQDPVTLINNRPIIGFNRAEIDRALKIH
jgi:glutaredoxin